VDLICLGIEIETIGYPSVVTAEDEDLRIVQGKRTKGVSW